jgi:hypothetical protein
LSALTPFSTLGVHQRPRLALARVERVEELDRVLAPVPGEVGRL